ncbi:hypothetical protein F4809DRAFT_490086 [Biscogniauxia mediterranea]|nr:hypothetical protein F4809DRAFT_490086 [Biscogniauxia mediterranea]
MFPRGGGKKGCALWCGVCVVYVCVWYVCASPDLQSDLHHVAPSFVDQPFSILTCRASRTRRGKRKKKKNPRPAYPFSPITRVDMVINQDMV